MTHKLSGIIICKNEEAYIERALKSLKDNVDEIIVIDDFSTDKTLEIAKKYTTKVYQRQLNNSFSDQRNFGISKASGDWIFFLDADEYVKPEFWEEVQLVINCEDPIYTEIKMWGIRREMMIDDKPVPNVYGEDINRRLFDRNTKYDGRVHEHPHWQGGVHRCGIMNSVIYHNKTQKRFETRKKYFNGLIELEKMETKMKYLEMRDAFVNHLEAIDEAQAQTVRGE